MVILKKEIVKPKKQILHGHTTIELKDVRTGKRERIEHDNTFTTAMDLFLRGNGSWNQSPWLNSTWKSVPIYQRLLGGVYLFRDTIADDQGVYPHFMPASNRMIANGSFGVGNATAVTELGTYNVNESYFTSSAMSFVYDWTTGQGNGQFQCVCLGSDVGGYIGYGNKTSNAAHSTLKSIIENQAPIEIACGCTNNFDGYQGVLSGPTLTLTRSADIFQGMIDIFPSGIDTITIEVPTDKIASDANKIWRCVGNGKIAVYPRDFDGDVYCGIYTISTSTWVWHELIAVGGVDLAYNSYVSENGFFYVNSSDRSKSFFYKFEADPSQDSKAQASFSALDVPCTEIMPNFWYGNGYLYNAGDDTLTRCNGEKINYNGAYPDNVYPVDLDSFRVLTTNYGNEYTKQYHNPFYLATVNNLDSSITKDQNTAMKLTYTITKESEGE